MSENSKIEWCDHTFNPWEGCQKIGPGCDHCYAEARNARFGGGAAINWGTGAPRRRTSTANWRKPIAWNAAHEEFFAKHGRRQRVFCASLADVFDNAVPNQWRADLFSLIAATPSLDWLLLTKRIGNVRAMLDKTAYLGTTDSVLDMMPLPNVWLGTTIVNQEEADRDIPKLLAVPARVRFLSMEPLLGTVDIARWLDPTGVACMDVCADTQYIKDGEVETYTANGECVPLCPACGESASWTGYDDGIDWVIAGGESGSHGRPTHPQWSRDLRDQCAAAGVPFLFKQWGEWMPAEHEGTKVTLRFASADATGPKQPDWFEWPDGQISAKVGKKAAGRLLDGHTHDEFPEAS